MALSHKPEPPAPYGATSGLPMRERLRIFGIGAGIGLMMVGLYFAGRKQMANLAAAEAAAQAAASADTNSTSNTTPNAAPPARPVQPAQPMPPKTP